MCSPSTLKVPLTVSPCWRRRGSSPLSVVLVSGEAEPGAEASFSQSGCQCLPERDLPHVPWVALNFPL